MVAMTSMDPVPQRLSDADRDAAVDLLRVHLDAGRLDQVEFSERMNLALQARTSSDFSPLFFDLPAPRPSGLASDTPTWKTYPGAGGSSSGPVSPTASPRSPEPSYPYGDAGPSNLPVPYAPGPVPRRRGSNALNMAQALVWPVAIFLFIFGHGGFTVIGMAIVASIILGQLSRNRRQPPPY